MRFYYVYKALAHPEHNGYLTPYTLEERLMHVAEAERTLGSRIPWLCDSMSNDLKTALGGVPNAELVLDPEGKVAAGRAWSDPEELRKDLERLVGTVKNPTKVSDLDLETEPPPPTVAKGIVDRVEVPGGMRPLRIEAVSDDPEIPFYVKLRAEADLAFLDGGAGTLYLGFHLDPLYRVHWNNLAKPLEAEIAVPEGVRVSPARWKAPTPSEPADADPREFLVDLQAEGRDEPLELTVRYFACDDADTFCIPVTQRYKVHLSADPNGGRVRRAGDRPGGGDPARRMLQFDADGDGRISRQEAPGRVQDRFDRIDTNGDGFLDADELHAMSAMRGGSRR